MYKTKKVVSIALAGATAASLVAVSAASVSAANGGYEGNFEITDTTTFGVVGDFTEWGEQPDVQLTDNDKDGVYEATVSVPETGSKYKVRADGDWAYSWGSADETGATANDQTNCSFDESVYGTEVTVYFDTRGGVDYWTVGTEKPADDVTPVEPSSEPSEEPSSEAPVVPAGKYDAAFEAAKTQLGEDNLSNYYFFDNSETKWTTVGAYWWTPEENAPWPGAPATQIEGTDIWAIQYNAETTTIIFNNLVSDDEYSIDNPKAQTVDVKNLLADDGAVNYAGNIYVPNMETEDVSEEGAVKKYDGAWTTFEGTVVETPVESSKEPTSTPAPATTDNNNSGKDGKGVATGDTAPVAIAAVFAAAALTAVVLTKKKVSSK